jgi:hypothetical protein
LPKATIRAIHRLAKRGERSRRIDRAVQQYISTHSTDKVRELLQEAGSTH